MRLTTQDFAILLALKEDPFMKMEELARRLNLPVTQVLDRVNLLKSEQVIKTPKAIYQPESLGLQRVNILSLCTSYHGLIRLEKACDEHPYTHYRARVYGGNMGLFIQFDIPYGSLPKLVRFFRTLKDLGYLQKTRIYPSTGLRKTIYPDLAKYNVHTSSWDFYWNIWYVSSLPTQPKKLPPPQRPQQDFSLFDPIDFKILRALTSDFSLTPKHLSDMFNLTLQDSQRRFDRVVKNYIDEIRFMYNQETFDLTEMMVAFGSGMGSSQFQERMYEGIVNNPPPFYLGLDILEGYKIQLWGRMSPIQVSEFTFASWEYIPEFQVHILDIKSNSMLYWFYPPNFDFQTRFWRTSENYMVLEPLERMENELKNM